ncbi:MAG: CFI-box-CTERM domain-containing protein [Candidatus Thorarchaeota archaeon]
MVRTNWSKGKGKGKGKPCAFTLAANNSPIAPMLDFLRNIRDNHLRKSRAGTLFVNSYEWIYYTITPDVAKVVVKNHRFKNFWKKLVVTPVTYFLTGVFRIFSKIS